MPLKLKQSTWWTKDTEIEKSYDTNVTVNHTSWSALWSSTNHNRIQSQWGASGFPGGAIFNQPAFMYGKGNCIYGYKSDNQDLNVEISWSESQQY
jgi:hypothetical protein